MRIPKTMSYSSLSNFEKDIEEFALKYLSSTRPERVPQDRAASVGSSFDARVKSDLHAAVYGKGSDPKYTFEALFEAQVEPQNRDFAGACGEHVYQGYVFSGFHKEILDLVTASPTPPRFEFDLVGEINGVPFLGKPDCQFGTKGGLTIVHDWKVNGFFGKSNTSPVKGYRLCKDGYADKKPNKSHNTAHPLHKPVDVRGFTVGELCMEDYSTGWADQLSLYGFVLGCKLGDPNVYLSVDQCTAKPHPTEGEMPLLRFSSYRGKVRKSYQELLVTRLRKCWDQINSGHIFPLLSPEQSAARMEILEQQAEYSHTEEDKQFMDAVRPKFRG